MKKITAIITLLFCALGFSQTTLGLYTERTTTNTTILNEQQNNVSTLNVAFADAGTDEGVSVMEIKADADNTNAQVYLNYPSPRLDISGYTTYHISLKSNSPDVTILRIEDEAGQQANLTNLVGDYGFAYDGNWHLLTIPLADFKAVNSTIDFTKIKNIFVVKTTPGASYPASSYIFYVDDVYLSYDGLLSVESFETVGIKMYPNPTNSEIYFTSKNKIDSFVIYNVLGQKVFESKSTVKLNISSLKSGVYYINAVTDGVVVTSKFIKK